TQAAVAHTTTLEVDVQDAERLALAAQAGNLSLALRRTGEAVVAPVRAVSNADVGPVMAAKAAGLRPVSHRTPVRTAAEVNRRSIVVVHGDAKSSVEVPHERGL